MSFNSNILQLSATRKIKAIQALKVIADEKEAKLLQALTKDEDEVVRSTAVETLGHLGWDFKEQIAECLLERLSDASEIVRSDAAESLGKLQLLQAAQSLRLLLFKDSSDLVKASAAEALGDISHPASSSDLLEVFLKEKSTIVRMYAVNALGLIGDSSFVNALNSISIADLEPEVSFEWLGARSRLGDPSAIQELLEVIPSTENSLLPNLFNLLDDIFSRNTPSSILESHRAELVRALNMISEKFPIHRPETKGIIYKITAN